MGSQPTANQGINLRGVVNDIMSGQISPQQAYQYLTTHVPEFNDFVEQIYGQTPEQAFTNAGYGDQYQNFLNSRPPGF